MRLSARAYHRILQVARAIADLEGTRQVGFAHMAEVVHYCPRSGTQLMIELPQLG